MLYANRHHRFLVLASVCLMVCSLDSKAADLDLGSVCDPSNGTEPDVKQRLEDDAARIELAAGQEIAAARIKTTGPILSSLHLVRSCDR